jgi:hypothetical protein
MDDNQVQILINAVDNASSKMKGVSSGLTDMVGKYLTAAGAISAVVAISKKVIDYYVEGTKKLLEYGDAVDNFTRLSGASNEEAQKLIIISQRLDVSQQALAKGMKELALNGIAPTVENLIKLGDEYKAIKDPTEQAKYVQEKFGRSGQEVAKILETERGTLSRLNVEVSKSSVLTDMQIQDINNLEDATNRYNIALETRQKLDAANAANFGTAWKNAMSWQIEATNTYTIGQRRLQEATASGLLTMQEYRKALSDFSYGFDLIAQRQSYAAEAVKSYSQDIDASTAAIIAQAAAMSETVPLYGTFATSLEEAKAVIGETTQYFKELTAETLFNYAAQGLSSEAALKLARSMGLINEETYGAIEATDDMKKLLSEGKLTLAEYNNLLAIMGARLDGLNSKDVYVNVFLTEYKRTLQGQWGAGQQTGGGWTQPVEAPAGGGAFYNASGASWRWIPAGYSENFAIGGGRANVSSGELHTVTRAGEKMPAEISKQSMRELASVVALQLKGILARQG